jgi:outer membrane protein assembly factor BamB
MHSRARRLLALAAVAACCLLSLVPGAHAGAANQAAGNAHAVTGAAAGGPLPATLSPAWSLHLDGEVEWQRVAPLGQLLVKTTSALLAIDPERGRVLWTHTDLGGLAQDHYEEIAGTPLVAISDGAARPRTVVLDAVDGRVVFDSAAAGVDQVLSRHLLPQSRALVLFGFRKGNPATTMFLVDAESGKLLWENDQLLAGAGKFTRRLTAFLQAATNQSGIVSDPLEADARTFLIASSTDIYAVDTRTGSIRWKVANANGARASRFFTTARTPDVVYVGSETATTMSSSMGSSPTGSSEVIYSVYEAHRLADGAAVWPEPVRIKGGLNDVIPDDRGLILSGRTTGKGKILLCDFKTGAGLWGKKGKGIEIEGGIVNHDWTDAGLVLTTGYDSAWTSKGEVFNLTLIDVKNGVLRFEEPLRLRGKIVSTQVVPAGLLYTTTSEADILDLSTGRPRLDGAVRSDESLVAVAGGKRLYTYGAKSGLLHLIDVANGTVTPLSRTPVRLEEDEAPLAIEAGADRITVLSSQNVIAWGLDGTLQFQAYHPSPRLPVMMRALLRAEQVRMGMAAVAAGAASATFATASTQTAPGSMDRAMTATLATGYAQAGAQAAVLSARYGEAARTRFKASTVAPDFVFMMVKTDRGSYGLAKVDKATGRILAVIDLGRDKEPIYEVDAVSNLIFYRPSPGTVVGYRF